MTALGDFLRASRNMLKVLDMQLALNQPRDVAPAPNQQSFYVVQNGMLQIQQDAAFVAEFLICTTGFIAGDTTFLSPQAPKTTTTFYMNDVGSSRVLTYSKSNNDVVGQGAVPAMALMPVATGGGYDYIYAFPAQYLLPRGTALQIRGSDHSTDNAEDDSFILSGYKVHGA